MSALTDSLNLFDRINMLNVQAIVRVNQYLTLIDLMANSIPHVCGFVIGATLHPMPFHLWRPTDDSACYREHIH